VLEKRNLCTAWIIEDMVEYQKRIEATRKNVVLYFHQECIFSVVELENLFKAQQVFPSLAFRLMLSRAAAERKSLFST
jgi:hypothetical protein